MNDKDLTPPSRSGGDAAHTVARAGIGSLPLVGAAGAELFNALVAPPLERRRDEWMRNVGEAINDLREISQIDLDQLRENPVFLDAVLTASQAAIRTGSADKRAALRNAVLNAALPSAPEEAIQQTLIRMVDEFTEWHLRLLDLYNDPAQWQQRNGVKIPEVYSGGPSHLIDYAYPQLRGRRDLYDQWWRELYQRGLVGTEQLHTMMTGSGVFAARTTQLGKELLRFVADPRESPSPVK